MERAVSLLESVLVDYERVLGPDHPSTLATRRALEPLQRRLAAAEEEPLHPGTDDTTPAGESPAREPREQGRRAGQE
ncbi:hypothetical protein [Actinomyces oricola]